MEEAKVLEKKGPTVIKGPTKRIGSKEPETTNKYYPLGFRRKVPLPKHQKIVCFHATF